MLVGSDESSGLYKTPVSGGGGGHGKKWCRTAVVNGRRRSTSNLSIKRTAGKPLLMKETWSLASPRPILAQLWRHGDRGNVCAAPGSDITHDAARRREVSSVVPSGSVGSRSREFPMTIQAEHLEVGSLVGGFIAAGNIRVQHRDHFRILEVATEVGCNLARAV